MKINSVHCFGPIVHGISDLELCRQLAKRMGTATMTCSLQRSDRVPTLATIVYTTVLHSHRIQVPNDLRFQSRPHDIPISNARVQDILQPAQPGGAKVIRDCDAVCHGRAVLEADAVVWSVDERFVTTAIVGRASYDVSLTLDLNVGAILGWTLLGRWSRGFAA